MAEEKIKSHESEERQEKKIALKSSDGKIFYVEEKAAAQSKILQFIIEDDIVHTCPIPIANVNGEVLEKIITYCRNHSDESLSPESVEKFDRKLFRDDWDNLMLLMEAADYLGIPDIIERGCNKIIDRIKVMPEKEVREKFKIKTDFTSEEEAELENNYPWAFQKYRVDEDVDEEKKTREEDVYTKIENVFITSDIPWPDN